MKNELIGALGTLITLLMLIRSFPRKKSSEERIKLEGRSYEPIEPDSRNLFEQVEAVISRASGVYNIAVGLFIIGVVAFLFITDSIARWIIVGTAALLFLIALVHLRRKARQSSTIVTDDPWEDTP